MIILSSWLIIPFPLHLHDDLGKILQVYIIYLFTLKVEIFFLIIFIGFSEDSKNLRKFLIF